MEDNEKIENENNTENSIIKVKLENPRKGESLSPDSFEVGIDLSNFQDAEDIANNKDQGPKYNLKIKKRDLVLIDEIANQEGVSRTELVNKLISSFLLKQLDSVKENDNRFTNYELKMLIASRADAIAEKLKNPDFQPNFILNHLGWSGEIVKDHMYRSMENVFNYGQFTQEVQPNGEINEEDYIEQSRTDSYRKIREKLLEI